MTCNLTYTDNTTAISDEAHWHSVLENGTANGRVVYHAVLLDGDVKQAEWRDGNMWIYNDTIDGISPLPVGVE